MSRSPRPPSPRLSVLVVTFHSEATIGACLASLAEEARRLPLEVLVVDSKSSGTSAAATLRSVRRELPEARWLALETNRGFGAACNAGARLATGELLLLLNPDARARPRALARLVELLDREPGCGAAGPRIVDERGHAELSFGRMPDLVSEALQKLLHDCAARGLRPARWLVERRSARPGEPDWVSGAALLTRRSLWEAAGGMDERLFLYFEDVDYCARIRALGHAIRFEPAAEVVHARGHSSRVIPERVRLEYRRSQLHFYRKHHGEQALAALKSYLLARLGLGELLAWAGGRRAEARISGEIARLVREF